MRFHDLVVLDRVFPRLLKIASWSLEEHVVRFFIGAGSDGACRNCTFGVFLHLCVARFWKAVGGSEQMAASQVELRAERKLQAAFSCKPPVAAHILQELRVVAKGGRYF